MCNAFQVLFLMSHWFWLHPLLYSAKASVYFYLSYRFLTSHCSNSEERAEVKATVPSSRWQKMKVKKTMLWCKSTMRQAVFVTPLLVDTLVSLTFPRVPLFQYDRWRFKKCKKWVYKQALDLWLWEADTRGRCVYNYCQWQLKGLLKRKRHHHKCKMHCISQQWLLLHTLGPHIQVFDYTWWWSHITKYKSKLKQQW